MTTGVTTLIRQSRTPFQIAFWVFVPILLASAAALAARGLLEPYLQQAFSNLNATKMFLNTLLHPSNVYDDSWMPMLNGLHIVQAGTTQGLYETLFFDWQTKFQYPPTSLLLVDALDQFGLAKVQVLNLINTACLVFTAFALAFLAFLAVRAFPALDRANPAVSLAMVPIAIGATFIAFPMAYAQNIGQVQILIDLLFTLACLAWFLGGRGLAGALIAAACAFKPQSALFLLWAILCREWIFARGFILVGAILIALSLARYGVHNHIEYLKVLSFLSERGEAYWLNESINGIVNRYFHTASPLAFDHFGYPAYNHTVYLATLVTSIAFVALLVVCALRRAGKANLLDVGIVAICSTAGSPIAWGFHYGILLPFYVLLLPKFLGDPPSPQRSWNLTLLGVSWFLLVTFIPFLAPLTGTGLEFLQAHVFYAAMILLFLLLRETRIIGAPSDRTIHSRTPTTAAA